MAPARGQNFTVEKVYFVSSFKNVIRSFLSLSFLSPPNAILVPGMYFFGFSRYSNCASTPSVFALFTSHTCGVSTYQSLLAPLDVFRLVRLRVGEAFHLPGVATEETVEVGADLVALVGLQVVALCAPCLEEVGAFLAVTCPIVSVRRSRHKTNRRRGSGLAGKDDWAFHSISNASRSLYML